MDPSRFKWFFAGWPAPFGRRGSSGFFWYFCWLAGPLLGRRGSSGFSCLLFAGWPVPLGNDEVAAVFSLVLFAGWPVPLGNDEVAAGFCALFVVLYFSRRLEIVFSFVCLGFFGYPLILISLYRDLVFYINFFLDCISTVCGACDLLGIGDFFPFVFV